MGAVSCWRTKYFVLDIRLAIKYIVSHLYWKYNFVDVKTGHYSCDFLMDEI